jgi:hypothetical protein
MKGEGPRTIPGPKFKIFKKRTADLGTEPMQNETLERWLELCQQAATEQHHHRFLELTREIIRMLTEKERRLSQPAKAGKTYSSVTGTKNP